MTITSHHKRSFFKLLAVAGMVALLAVLSLLPASANPGTTERVSVDSAGNQGDGDSSGSTMAADGRFVAFLSDASNLVANDDNDGNDIFVHDGQTGVTERISVSLTGGDQDKPKATGFLLDITPDGRFVAFDSGSTNLVAGDGNSRSDVSSITSTTRSAT